jgi:hypothetical protein
MLHRAARRSTAHTRGGRGPDETHRLHREHVECERNETRGDASSEKQEGKETHTEADPLQCRESRCSDAIVVVRFDSDFRIRSQGGLN